ncbi:MAG TPA: NADH-quinone oxidoreductase subunit NuoG [Bacteroidia bacterium]|nr:NADH-quinone oxidoreductase subunit NuoG [Bacteroidia bacterium]
MFGDIRFYLDDCDYVTVQGNTIIQSSLSIGLEIPRFCYHEKLSIAGNCRMCLLEISYPRSLKPLASCALPIMANMSIYTGTVMVKRAREGVLELLLLNHPLDCPVCDQAGECDLQDETAAFGGDRGRFYEAKRTVKDKDCGPIVKTSMIRCIHCTKCIRLCNEVFGEPSLGSLGRGVEMEIGMYDEEESIESELSGNLPDVCPVGALTSKPYAFRARPWELRSFETVDVIDSIGSRIRVDIRGNEVMRILPSQAEDVNEDWITDRTRFSYDGLKTQRLNAPMVKINGNFVPVSLDTAFRVSAKFLKSFIYPNSPMEETYLNIFLDKKTAIHGFFGDLTDTETLVALSDFFRELGANDVLFQENLNLCCDFRSNYLLNLSMDVIEKIDLCILIGLNIRLELPLLNLRIRKAFLYNNALIISFGFLTNLTYQYFQQGNTLNSVFNFLKGKSYVSKCLLDSSFPLILVGTDFVKLLSSTFCFEIFKSLAKYSNLFTETGWLGVSFVDSRISLNAARDLGFQYSGLNDEVVSRSSFIFLCNPEKALNICNVLNPFFFKIFLGHIGDSNAFLADVILPGSSFLEKDSLYLTLEGRVQKTKFLLTAPGFSRPDWKLVVALRLYFFTNFVDERLLVTDKTAPVVKEQLSEIDSIRRRIIDFSPSFCVPEVVNSLPSHTFFNFFSFAKYPMVYRGLFYVQNFLFVGNTTNFFFNNSITKNSKVMAVCAGRYSLRQRNFWK